MEWENSLFGGTSLDPALLRGASTPAPGSRHVARTAKMQCGACSKRENDCEKLLFCDHCGASVHAICLSSFISPRNGCPCGHGCNFSGASNKQRKRQLLSRSGDAPTTGTPAAPEICTDFFKLNDDGSEPSMRQLFQAFGGWTSQQTRIDAVINTRLANIEGIIETTEAKVDKAVKTANRADKTSQRNDAKLLLSELVVNGIPGDRIPEIKANFIAVCKYLNVNVEPLDIATVRYMRRDPTAVKVKLHNVCIRLYDGKMAATILMARKSTEKRKVDMRLQSIFTGPDIPDKKLYIRPCITDAQRLLLLEVKQWAEKNSYKFAWTDDYGIIWLKRDENSTPIAIHSSRALSRIQSATD